MGVEIYGAFDNININSNAGLIQLQSGFWTASNPISVRLGYWGSPIGLC